MLEVRIAPDSAPSMMFSTTDMLSTSMKCWCTMPMPCGDGVVGACGSSPSCRPAIRICTGIGLIEAVQDATSAWTCRRRSHRQCRGSTAGPDGEVDISLLAWTGPKALARYPRSSMAGGASSAVAGGPIWLLLGGHRRRRAVVDAALIGLRLGGRFQVKRTRVTRPVTRPMQSAPTREEGSHDHGSSAGLQLRPNRSSC